MISITTTILFRFRKFSFRLHSLAQTIYCLLQHSTGLHLIFSKRFFWQFHFQFTFWYSFCSHFLLLRRLHVNENKTKREGKNTSKIIFLLITVARLCRAEVKSSPSVEDSLALEDGNAMVVSRSTTSKFWNDFNARHWIQFIFYGAFRHVRPFLRLQMLLSSAFFSPHFSFLFNLV